MTSQAIINQEEIETLAQSFNSKINGLTTTHLKAIMKEYKDLLIVSYTHSSCTKDTNKCIVFIQACTIALERRYENPWVIPTALLA